MPFPAVGFGRLGAALPLHPGRPANAPVARGVVLSAAVQLSAVAKFHA